MSNLLLGGIIATVAVIGLGLLYIVPPYITAIQSSQKLPEVVLSLSMVSEDNMPQWCQSIADLLNKNELRANIFVTGKIAEENPTCLRSFNQNVDIGSSTYGFAKLTTERDYADQLRDVGRGKASVDSTARINSTLFKAPYGYTDDNIYSLLSRNGIFADFSGGQSYNTFNGKMFIKYDLRTFDLSKYSTSDIESSVSGKVASQIQITADNHVPAEKIEYLVNTLLEKHEADFINASDITGMRLTERT